MSTLAELKRLFEDGTLQKAEFIEQAFAIHRTLFDFVEAVAAVDLERLEILPTGVVVTTRRDGVRLHVDPQDRRSIPLEILNFGSFEPSETDLMTGLLRPGDTFLDIGANCGWYSLVAARRVPGLVVHAFEPVPPTFRMLTGNLALNGVTNVTAHNAGLSDSAGVRDVFFYPEGYGNASLMNLTQGPTVTSVPCTFHRLDELAPSLVTAVDAIKCDVEGAELLVLRGARETLAKHRPALFLEMLRKWTAPFGYHPNDTITFLAGLGYVAFAPHDGALRPFGLMDEATRETNFFFLHRERHAKTIAALP